MLQHFPHLPRLQHLHEGQGPARLALHHQPHLRDLRRQPRHLRHLRAEHGLRDQDAAAGRVDPQPRRGRRVHVRPQHLPGQPGRRRFLRADGEGDQSFCPGEGAAAGSAEREAARLPHHRRHHAGAQSVQRRLLPRGPGDEPDDAGDVLPDGRPARASFHALSGRRRDRSHRAAVHRLSHAADEVRGVHEEGGAAPRRPLRLLLRGLAGIREGRIPADAARMLGGVPGS